MIEKNPALKREVKAARRDEVPDGIIKRVIQFARQGYAKFEFDTYDTDWELEAYLTVSGQNSNNSVRLPDEFLHAVETDGEWSLHAPPRRQGLQDHEGPRFVGEDRLRRLGLGRSGRAISHHHQRLAHLPRVRGRSAPPIRAPSTCSSTTRPAISRPSTCFSSAIPRPRRSTSKLMSTRFACGR